MELQLPQEFCAKIRQMLGPEANAFFDSYAKPRYQALRINPLKATSEEFLRLVPWNLTPVPWAGGGFYYNNNDHPGKSAFHEAGLYYIQEPSAMIVGALSGVRPGEHVLDLCAAPGGKSTHLAGQMHGEGLLISNEIHPQRARILSRNIERFGIRNAVVTNEPSERLAEHFPFFFDRIIVDAPCSGEGMFRKEEAALTDWSQDTVLRCAGRQKEILEQADAMLKPGGTLVYSTCTFSREENEDNIRWFLENHTEYAQRNIPEWLGERMKAWGLSAGLDRRSLRLWPHKLDGEGHFLAILHKNGLLQHTRQNVRKNSKAHDRRSGRKSSFGKTQAGSSKEIQAAWNTFAKEALSGSFTLPSGKSLTCFGDELYVLPDGISADDLAGLKVLRPGLDLGTLKKNRFEPSHALVLSLKKEDLNRLLDLKADSREVQAYLHGESLYNEGIPRDSGGWTAVTVSGYPLGWGKVSGGILKNHYPKGLRTQF